MQKLFSITALVFLTAAVYAQSDSLTAPSPVTYTRSDSMYLVKMNNTANLMLAGGVGLCGAGSYLVYQGTKVYGAKVSTNPNNQIAEMARNHKQGTIYMLAGGASILGGIALIAIGTTNKIEFKRGMKRMQLQTGLLDNGRLGLALSF